MTKSIFRRIFWLYALVLFLAIVFIEIYITSTVRGNYTDILRRNIGVQIDLISNNVDFTRLNLDALCRQLKEKTGARVTVIANDGRVIGDSDADSSRMDNHSNRIEIEQSLLFDAGTSIRYSDTLRHDFLYVAKRIGGSDAGGGFIRLAVPLKEVDGAVNRLRFKLILVVGMILLATWLFSISQTEHLRRLLRQIMGFSRSLARGEIDKRLFLRGAGEFDEIARNLNTMSLELQETITRNEEERERLNEILKSIPDALLIIDPKGIVLLSSSASPEFFGDIPITGKHFIEIVRNNEVSDMVEKVRKTHSSGVTEFTLANPDEKHIVVRVSPLFYTDKELSGFVAVFHDITQLKKLEQMRKDFVANVSHEIKTPITAIKGFADTLLDGALDDRENAVRFLRTIKSNSERINSLVDDLMTISKIELGVIKVEKTMIDVEDVLESVLEIFKDRAEAKNLFLRVSNKPGLEKISADRDRLIQILNNLVDNALKFTEGGGVTFGVDTVDERVFLFVEDTGIGVPPKYLPRLGERFFRVDPARSRKMGGTGLGLAIVKHLVRAHGWDMQIESVYGKGTKVKILQS